jgi:cytochrome c
MPFSRMAAVLVPVAVGAALAPVVACTAGRPSIDVEVAGDPAAGEEAIGELGCGACHTIPGVRGADAHVGPPLTDWARRSYIVGSVANTPENLERFILDPEDLRPGTAMPDVGATEEQAADIAAYLFTVGD